jgi:hypothetical protein
MIAVMGRFFLGLLVPWLVLHGTSAAAPPAEPAWILKANAATLLGVAVRQGTAICLYLADTGPPPRASVTIVTMDTPQTLVRAGLAGSAKACPDSVTPHMAAFSLALTSGTLAEHVASVAILAPGPVRIDKGAAVWSWNGAVTFRSCTSADGVHLTAWRGGARLWHAYYYVGQDLEPDCTDAESKP